MTKLFTYRTILLPFVVLFSYLGHAQTSEVLSLEAAKQRALSQNKLLVVQQEKVNELGFKKDEIASKNLPMLYLAANYLHSFNENNFVIPQGGLGDILNIPIPWNDFTLYEGKQDMFAAGLFAYQPISQLFRVNNGVKAMEAEVDVERFKLKMAVSEIENSIEKLYYAIRIQEKKIKTAQTNIAWAESQLYDAESALLAQETQQVNVMGLKANLADKKHAYLVEQIALENYIVDLKTLLMIPDSTAITLEHQPVKTYHLNSKNYYAIQSHNNNELLSAKKQIEAANHGSDASKNAYIPDLGVVGGVAYQGIIPELPDMNYFLGVNMTWNVLGFGKNRAQLGQSIAKQNQAKAYAEYTISNISANIDKAYRNAVQAQQLMAVAQEAYTFRLEEYRIKEDGVNTGLLTQKELLETKSALDKADEDAFAARLNFNMAVLDLNALIGK
ncbi:TolC family protein [Formosa haliotis]|uniref:TolC family protein n=1 Tax=Formosa haliotis TaxID=1555194 RepID=UPI0008257397|nr:TolC family protein [Formosa haliotis]